MPEGPEVEKLRRQLDYAWQGRTFTDIISIWDKSNKFFVSRKGHEEFLQKIRGQIVAGVARHGKWLEVESANGTIFAFHLGGTGWLVSELPQNIPPSMPHKNFLHKVNDKTKRFRLYVSAGTAFEMGWDYYDSRTWGKFIIPEVGDEPWKEYGPDWIKDPDGAIKALEEYETRGQYTIKQVLCDPYVAAGVGNYLACEATFRAGILPNSRWWTLSQDDRRRLGEVVKDTVDLAMKNDDHSWWAVFKRRGYKCTWCRSIIQYMKDPGASRGSYFCPFCQRS